MKITSSIKRIFYVLAFGIIFISGQFFLGSNKVDVEEEIAKQIEAKFEVELRTSEKSNNKLSIEDALELKNIKPTQGGIEKDKLESLIKGRINEPLKGRQFEPKTPEGKRAELNRLDELYASTKSAKVLLNSSGQPKAIYPKYTQSVESHDAFIKESAKLLDLNVPGSSLNVTRENRCIGNQCVSRYQRMAFGVPVLFSDMTLTTVDGKVISMTGALNQPNISKEMVENGDVLSEAELLEVAQSKLLGQWQITKSTYGIYESTGGAAPAYEVELRSGFRQYDMVIHAGTKTILNENDRLKHSTNASGLDLRGQRREFSTIPYQGRNYLRDTRLPSGASTTVYDAFLAGITGRYDNTGRPIYFDNAGQKINYISQYGFSTNTMVSSASTDSGWNSSAVSVISHFDTLFNYFSDTHGYRFGETGAEAQPIRLIVDIEFETQANAFNLGTIMGFGKTSDTNYADSFEVVGHELGHGIVGDLAGLRGNGWPDTLNESFSDLFGVLASPQAGWGVGDDSPNAVVRSMSNPSSFGGAMYYRQYDPNVSIYTNAGISNYFFYLIAEGLTSDNLGVSIGRGPLAQIAFGTLSSLSSRAEFNDVYNGMVAKAEELHGEGSTEVQAIERAAEVIGYKQIADNTETTVITKNSVFNANGRNITAFVSANYITNAYDLYLQYFDSDEPIFNEDNVIRFEAGISAYAPAITTVNDGEDEASITFYKKPDGSVHYIEFDADANIITDEYFPASTGQYISQLQISSDFKYIAFSYTDAEESYKNIIGLYSIDEDELTTLAPTLPIYTENTNGLSVEYIDAIDFDPTNRRLVFDYLACEEDTSSEFADNCAWRIGVYDIISDTYQYPFARLQSNVDVGNPSFANISSDFIVFDVFYDDYDISEIWTLNTNTGEAKSITASVTASVTRVNFTSRPSFTQDDSGLVFSVRQSDDFPDGYLYHQPISDYDDIEGDNGEYLNAINSAIFPITASLNYVDARPSLTLSSTAIDFGDIITVAQSTVCLSNSTTYPIQIYSVNNELEALNLAAIPNYVSSGEQYCLPIAIDVTDMDAGDFSQDVRLVHDGLNSPSIITVSGAKVPDYDNDGIPDATDPDDDNDGAADVDDAFPFDATETEDTDNDGIGNNIDTDDDNDGLSDVKEQQLGTSRIKPDTDGDSLSDLFEYESLSRNPLIADYHLEIDWQTACFTDSNGIKCWGKNDFDLLEPPAIKNASAISMSGIQACAIAPGSGNASCWGANNAPAPTEGYLQDIAVGQYHICTLKDSTIKCLSSVGNQYGILNIPSELPASPLSIESGNLHACAILSNGEVKCWGAENLELSDARQKAGKSTSTIFDSFDSAPYVNCGSKGSEIECFGENADIIENLDIGNEHIYNLAVLDAALCLVNANGISCYGTVNGTQMESPTFLTSSTGVVAMGKAFACALDEMKIKCWGYDTDNHGVLIPPEVTLGDFDADGLLDNIDTDDDNDGVSDTVDTYPLVAIGNLIDTDSDGAPDTCEAACVELGMVADTDDDNDDVVDDVDVYPLISIGDLTDTDSDGAPDECDDSCLALGMSADDDDDGDGVLDTADAYPLISLEGLADNDRDGAPDSCDGNCIELGMTADNDDDNDFYPDENDSEPLNPKVSFSNNQSFTVFDSNSTSSNVNLLASNTLLETITPSSGSETWISYSNDFITNGKHYWEVTAKCGGDTLGASFSLVDQNLEVIELTQITTDGARDSDGNYYLENFEQTAADDVFMFAINMENKTYFIGKNGTWFRKGKPSLNQSPLVNDLPEKVKFKVQIGSRECQPNKLLANFGHTDFSYDPPLAYFKGYCTNNSCEIFEGVDTDNDGIVDQLDKFPLIDIGSLFDTDSDGAPDNCDEACMALGMTADDDDDGDGVLDVRDEFPLISLGNLLDSDGDGIPNECDQSCLTLGLEADNDDDNDGIIDLDDAFPTVSLNLLDNLGLSFSESIGFIHDDLVWMRLDVAKSIISKFDAGRDDINEYAISKSLYENGILKNWRHASYTEFEHLIKSEIGNNINIDITQVGTGLFKSSNVNKSQSLRLQEKIGLTSTVYNDGAQGYQFRTTGHLETNEGIEIWGEIVIYDYNEISFVTIRDRASQSNPDDSIGAGSWLVIPLDRFEPTLRLDDSDGDGIPDDCFSICATLKLASDTDDDNDGVLDTDDLYPFIAIGNLIDTDSDGAPDTCEAACVELGMVADTDDDNDDVVDDVDVYPLISIGDLTDTDSDGAPDECDDSCLALGMSADSDDDNDSLLDKAELALGTNPKMSDTDGDGINDNEDNLTVIISSVFPSLNVSVISPFEDLERGSFRLTSIVNPNMQVIYPTSITGNKVAFEYKFHPNVVSSEYRISTVSLIRENGDVVQDDQDYYFDLVNENDSASEFSIQDPNVIYNKELGIVNVKFIVDGLVGGISRIWPVGNDNRLNMNITFVDENDLSIQASVLKREVLAGLNGTNVLNFEYSISGESLPETIYVQSIALTDKALNGARYNADTDNDNIIDVLDAYPLTPITGYVDVNKNGAPEQCDESCIALGMSLEDVSEPKYYLLEQSSFDFASLTPTAKVIVTGSDGENFFDIARYVDAVSTVGQTFLVSGSSSIDGFRVMPGVKYDLTNLKGSVDTLYFSGPLSEYAGSILLDSSTGVMQLSRLTDIGEEVVQFIASNTAADVLVFSDGAISTSEVKTAVLNNTDLTTLTLDTSVSAMDDKVTTGAQVKHIILDNDGAGAMALGPNIQTLISGSRGVDQIYVPEGSVVDASNLKSGQDEVYVQGDLADYDKALDPSGNIILTREVTIDTETYTESITVASGGNVATNDLVIFADQQLDAASLRLKVGN